MYNESILRQLSERWPETDDYLRRVGQVTNDLMVMREILRADEYQPTWLEALAIDEVDLLKTPTAVEAMQFLFRQGIEIRSAEQVPDYQELRQEQLEEYAAGDTSIFEILEVPGFAVRNETDAQLWALPELQEKVLAWATATAKRHDYRGDPLTLTQAAILVQLCSFLEQEPEQSPGLAAESLRSALSSEFFEKAGNLPK